MKKIILSLVAVSAMSSAAFADHNHNSNSRNSGYNQFFFSHQTVDRKYDKEDTRALAVIGKNAVVGKKAMTQDQRIGLKTNYHGNFIN